MRVAVQQEEQEAVAWGNPFYSSSTLPIFKSHKIQQLVHINYCKIQLDSEADCAAETAY